MECARCRTIHRTVTVDEVMDGVDALERLPNPVWLDKSVTRGWDSLKKGPSRPKVNTRKVRKLLHVKPYGCGTWGCVMPTDDPRIVLKVTSDPAEAWLIDKLIRKRISPEGLVRYYAMTRLPGEKAGEPLYAIWREDAYEVGDVKERRGEDVALLGDRLQRLFEFADNVDDIGRAMPVRQRAAGLSEAEAIARSPGAAHVLVTGRGDDIEAVAPRGSSAVWKAAANFEAYVTLARRMARPEETGRLVPAAMLELARRGIVLADVRDTNIGRVNRGKKRGLIVITDPGMACPMRENVTPPKV